MKLDEISPKKERSLKRIVNRIKKEYPKSFKSGAYKIQAEWDSPTKAWIEINIDDAGLLHDKASYEFLGKEVEDIINADDVVMKGAFEGGSIYPLLNYAVWSVQYASNA